MQKDIHFYGTLAMAVKAGIEPDIALQIAWANQFTDDCTDASEYGTVTQCKSLTNWADPVVQENVIIPFHFVPGGEGENPWIVQANRRAVTALMPTMLDPTDIFRLGIALHMVQDSYSHQGFSGWEEKGNERNSWWYLNWLPAIGHTQVGVAPDVTDGVWRENGVQVDNSSRAFWSLEAGVSWLRTYATDRSQEIDYEQLGIDTAGVCESAGYENRKQMFRDMAGLPDVRYSRLDAIKWHQPFIEAARMHRAAATRMFPRAVNV